MSNDQGGVERILAEQRARMDDVHRTEDERRMVVLATAIVREEMTEHGLTPKERVWVREQIDMQSRRGRFLGGILEKTAAGVVWATIVGLGYAAVEYARIKLGANKV